VGRIGVVLLVLVAMGAALETLARKVSPDENRGPDAVWVEVGELRHLAPDLDVWVASSRLETNADGQRTLRVGRSQGLAPSGQTVAVAGSGYDVSKGVYVALCLVTPADQAPSPCGGGIDIDGVSGASAWISSNPPSYGEGLAQPYGEGGSFSVTVDVGPSLAGGID